MGSLKTLFNYEITIQLQLEIVFNTILNIL